MHAGSSRRRKGSAQSVIEMRGALCWRDAAKLDRLSTMPFATGVFAEAPGSAIHSNARKPTRIMEVNVADHRIVRTHGNPVRGAGCMAAMTSPVNFAACGNVTDVLLVLITLALKACADSIRVRHEAHSFT